MSGISRIFGNLFTNPKELPAWERWGDRGITFEQMEEAGMTYGSLP